MIPNENSYCEIDPTVVDRWGIPVLRFHLKWSDHELKQVKHMQETFRAIIHEMGGTPMSPMPTAEQGYGIEPGGRIIHEVGCVRMGNDPKTSVLNSNCQAHDCQEPVRHRRRPVRDQPGQERDVDDPGAGDAHQRVHRRSAEGGQHMNPPREATADKSLQVLKFCSRRRRRRFAWTDAEAAQAAASAQAARAAATAKPFVPKFFTANEFKLVRMLADIIIPKDERSGSATDAGVPEFMDFMMIDQPARQVAMRGGLAWLDVECQQRFDKTFLNCAEAERTAVLDDIAWPSRAQAGVRARRRVLQQLPRSHRERLLDDADGDRRSAVHGQPLRRAMERLSAGSAEEARRQLRITGIREASCG